MTSKLSQQSSVAVVFLALFFTACGDVSIPQTVDNTAPTVSSVRAGDTTLEPTGSTVPIDSVLRVIFSEVMKETTVTDTTITLKDGDNNSVTGNVETITNSDGVRNKEFTFTPEANLTPALSYTLTIVGNADGVKDIMGNALADDVAYTFTAEE